MIFSATQINVLKNSSKRLMIIGKFSIVDDDGKKVIFNNEDPNAANVDPLEFFDRVRPELRMIAKGTKKIGRRLFNSYSLKTPAKITPQQLGEPMPLLIDSPLIEQGDTQNYQAQGGELFKDLLENLDQVLPFLHSSFVTALLMIAESYMFHWAHKELEPTDEEIDYNEWTQLCMTAPALNSAVFNYMIAYEQDEKQLLTEIDKQLQLTDANTDANIDIAKQQLLIKGLQHCKSVLETQDQDDAIFQTIAALEEFKDWLPPSTNYAANENVGIEVQKVGNNSFIAYYSHFRRNSDALHRFVRSDSLHSFLFVWLASQYAEHDFAGKTMNQAAAKRMFEVGVENQDDRSFSETTAEEKEKEQEIKKAQSQLTDEEREKLYADENYQDFEKSRDKDIYETLLPERAFTQKALEKRLTKLFQILGQKAVGKAGELLEDNRKFNEPYNKWYRVLLNVRCEEGGILTADNFRQALQKAGAKDDLINATVKPLENADDADKKSLAKSAFIKYYAVASKTKFDRAWLENQDEITTQSTHFEALYQKRHGFEVKGEEDKAGIPGFVLTDVSIPNADSLEDEQRQKRRQQRKKMEKAAHATNTPKTVHASKPVQLEKVKVGQEGVLKNGEDTVAKVSFNETGLTIEKNAETQSALDLKETQLHVDGETYQLTELDIPEVKELDAPQEKNTLENWQQHYDELSKVSDAIGEKYKNQADKEFCQSTRALLLGEYIQAAPERQVKLDIPDLSQIYGIMVDMVEHIGDMSLGDQLYTTAPTEGFDNALSQINLSRYYPVNTSGELNTVLQYHYSRCQIRNQANEYLEEVNQIRDMLKALSSTDIQIVFLNETVQEHLDENAAAVSELFFCQDYPSVVYLTKQAKANPAALGTLQQKLAQAICDTQIDQVQLPIIVSENAIDDLGLPIISPKLPHLARYVRDKKLGKVPAESIEIELPEAQPLVSPLLAFSASLAASHADFGKIANRFRDDAKKSVKGNLGIDLKKNEDLVQFFKRAWFDPKSHWVSWVIYVKWLNVLILAKRDNDTLQLTKDIGKWLVACYEEYPQAFQATFGQMGIWQNKLEIGIDDGGRIPNQVSDKSSGLPMDKAFSVKSPQPEGKWINFTGTWHKKLAQDIGKELDKLAVEK
jgi:hypothetical protein